MFVLIMDRCNGPMPGNKYFVTIHATCAEAEQTIKKYAREAFSEKCGMDDEWPDNEWPETLANCVKWLADGCEYVKLFRADPGGGRGEEIKLGDEVEAVQQAA